MTSSADARPSPVRHDLKSRPACHRKREYTDAHLSIVFAALAVTSFIEDRTGRSIKRSARTARHYRTTRSGPGRSGDDETQLARRTGGQHEQQGAPAWLNAPRPRPWTCPP
jgi:hypothetical protein